MSLLLYESKETIFGLWSKQGSEELPLALRNTDQHFSPFSDIL